MMRLGDLLSKLSPVRLPSRLSQEITSLSCDSRTAGAGTLFVCLCGAQTDAHVYARDAYARGARAFLCEYPPKDLPPDASVAFVPDTRAAIAPLAAAFYGHPEHALCLIGITGTKGKSTTAEMICRILEHAGVAVGYIGSGGARYGNTRLSTVNTTPEPLTLFRILADMRRHGMRAVVVEVSSQALATHRTDGLLFPITLFTNLAPDHIGVGEHPDFAHYRQEKARLFSEHGAHVMIVDGDDEATPYMLARATADKVLSVSCTRRDADLFIASARPHRANGHFGSAFLLETRVGERVPLSLSLPGLCNAKNAALALLASRAYLAEYGEGRACDLHTLAPSLTDFSLRGRFEWVRTALPCVDFVIDYAHNGYSLSAAIEALRAFSPARLVCLFGSVGARTYSRRTELARAAAAADFCIVTTDNPDSEPPEDTMRELCRTLDEASCEYVAIPDRREALSYAVRHARPGDLVLLAGKGHEEYQLIDGRRIPFSEREILLEEASRLPLAAFAAE